VDAPEVVVQELRAHGSLERRDPNTLRVDAVEDAADDPVLPGRIDALEDEQ